jgi:MarR family transcriptional regulator, organic hydroperoxide resistance regulator
MCRSKHFRTLELGCSMSAILDDARQFWARILQHSGSQWILLLAVGDLDDGDGAPLHAISDYLGVNSNFITSQLKVLEKKDFIRRVPPTHATPLRLSLTDKTLNYLTEYHATMQKQREHH